MPFDPREKQAYMEASPAQREVVRKLLCNLLALLRAQYLSYQTAHWQQVGDSFYGNHLLFQRLYGSVQGQIDQLAEKIVGYLGSDPVGLDLQAPVIARYGVRWASIKCHHRRGVQAERDCQAAIKAAYDGIKAAQAMTLGLDDWLMAAANAHEENTYLLQQVLQTPPMKVAKLVERWASEAPSAEGDFRPNPRKEEVAEFAESGAISNDPEIAAKATQMEKLDESPAKEVADAKAAPPTPTEVAEMPGGDAVSTLNRYVVESEDPKAQEATSFNQQRLASWIAEIEGKL